MQMQSLPNEQPIEDCILRDSCYGCFRPSCDCFCDSIPSIDNRTEVLIVQHVRERFHPFNTARIVQRALQNSSLLVDQTKNLAARLRLKPRAGLLYPGAGARLISELLAEERPEQLVILDGTWHHAKTFVRDIRELAELPRYRLAPAVGSRYRIRREPDAMSLSTVEASVAALRALEPDTRGLEQLLAAFDRMVERQLAHPKAEYGRRRNLGRKRTPRNIPNALINDLPNLVVAYGESVAREVDRGRAPRPPVYWVAQRLGTGERFACAIQSEQPLEDSLIGHLELTRDDFAGALTLNEARSAWAAYLGPSDTLAVYNQGTARLLKYLSGVATPHLLLKSIDFNPQRRYGILDELVVAERIAPSSPQHPGRAGKRLANAVALVRYLNALGNAAAPEKIARNASFQSS